MGSLSQSYIYLDFIYLIKKKHGPYKISEPRSNIAGKVSKERFEGNSFITGEPAVLLCPGQGFPIPKYE